MKIQRFVLAGLVAMLAASGYAGNLDFRASAESAVGAVPRLELQVAPAVDFPIFNGSAAEAPVAAALAGDAPEGPAVSPIVSAEPSLAPALSDDDGFQSAEAAPLKINFDGGRRFKAQQRWSAIAARRERAAASSYYHLAEGDPKGDDATKAKMTTEQSIAYAKSKVFRDWVAAENKAGRQVFLWRDIDKTQARGDLFTFFLKWRADNGKITPEQNQIIKEYLKTLAFQDAKLAEELKKADSNDGKANGNLLIKLWRSKEDGGEGIGLLDLWKIYWLTQKGLTREEKIAEVEAFAPHYASRVYPDVREENLAYRAAGVHVVAVSNGDEDPARAIAPLLGIAKTHVVGAKLEYVDGVANGKDDSHEIFDKEFEKEPQPGKVQFINEWLEANLGRLGWTQLDSNRVVSLGFDGDSRSTDGGGMLLLSYPVRLANRVIDTPREPKRRDNFMDLFQTPGNRRDRGRVVTLLRDPKAPGAWIDEDWQDMSLPAKP